MQFLKPGTIALIPPGGYACNNKYSTKAIIWLLHMEQTDVVAINHARNGLEYRLHELPHYSVHGYSAQKIYCTSFSGFIFLAAPVKRFVTSLLQTETYLRSDMYRQWHDWSRYLVPDTRSIFSGSVNLIILVYLHPNCLPTQQCPRVLCVPGTLCTVVKQRTCYYTIRPGKARLFIM